MVVMVESSAYYFKARHLSLAAKAWPCGLSCAGCVAISLSSMAHHAGTRDGTGRWKFAFFMGLLLGFPNIIVACYLAFLTGAVAGVILILLRKKI